MKWSMIALLTLCVVVGGYACEEEDDPTNDGIEEMTENETQDDIRFEVENCEGPNWVFGNKCCSIQGTWGGTCKIDRDWISAGDCKEAFVHSGMQYCCGGEYLMDMGARGFQCIAE